MKLLSREILGSANVPITNSFCFHWQNKELQNKMKQAVKNIYFINECIKKSSPDYKT
jgi:hypothetical protein